MDKWILSNLVEDEIQRYGAGQKRMMDVWRDNEHVVWRDSELIEETGWKDGK